MSGRLKTKR